MKGEDHAFQTLKQHLCTPPILAYPSFGPQAGRFVLDTDASTDHGIGAVLSQEQPDGSERVIAYGSRSLHASEKNYCATRLEMLAFVEFIEHFRYYLLGSKFLVRTYHRALKWLLTFREPRAHVARWIERLQEYEFDVEHRPRTKAWECRCNVPETSASTQTWRLSVMLPARFRYG